MIQIGSCNLRIYKRYKKRHMAKVGKEKIDELIKEMSHYDPDNMEMGAKRLTEMILAGEVNLEADEKIANAVREAFMKQIESENDTVQSEAIKYLADIVSKLPSAQVEIIFEKILQYITNLDLVEKKRERYGACAATVIHQAAEEFGHKLENLFLKSIVKLLEFKDKKTEIEIILINIITEFIKKWPNVAAHLKYDRRNLVIYLLKNVETKSKLDIIKKSENCIGKLSLIGQRDVLDIILNDNDWGLVVSLSRNKNKTKIENLKLLRNGLLCLSQILRTHNVELRHWIKPITLLLIEIVNQFKSYEQIDEIEIVCDILDAALTSLSYSLKTFNRELKETLQHRENPFNNFILELINFNVEGMMSYAGESMEIEQEYGGDDDYYEEAEVDEKCWKVRRSALFYISFLAKYDKNLLDRIGNGEFIEDFGNKLVEEHSMVSQMAFVTFNTLIELISVDRALTSDESAIEELSLQRVKSSALEIADKLIKEITSKIKIVFNNSKFNDQLKIEASKILLRIIQIYNHILINSESDTFQLVFFIIEQLKKTAIVENKANLLLCLKELVSNEHSFEKYQKVFDLFFDLIAKNTNVKIVNICILSLKKIVELFSSEIAKLPTHFTRIIQLIRTKVKEFDGDKSVKYATLKCLSSLFEFYQLFEEDIVYFLEMLSCKLKIEVEKLYIIETIIRLKNTKASSDKNKILETLVKQIAENLGSNNYELNIKSIEAIHQLFSILGSSCNQRIIEQLLEKSKMLLNDGKIPSFFKIIIDISPKLLKPYSELIIRSTESYYISRLITNGVVDANSVVKILKTLDLQDKAKKISLTLSTINLKQEQLIAQIDESSWGRILIGALGYIGDERTLNLLFKFMNEFKADESRFETASAIGNIVSRNQDKFVPELVARANNVKDVYMFIYIFKEMLTYNIKTFGFITELIEWLLLKSENKFEAESNYYITSECVGKLAFISSNATKKVIANASSQNQNRRLIVANSLRYGLENRENAEAEFIHEYVSIIVKLMSDQKVRVREGAVKSLVSVAQSYIKEIKNYSTEKGFWNCLLGNCTINDSLIVIIDYGICKEIRDEGKNLRLESFNLLQLLVKKIHLDTHIIDDIMSVALSRLNDESSNDIILKRLSILKTLCEIDYSHFIRHQEDFIKKLGLKEGIFKKYQSKGLEDERAEIYVKGVLKEIYDINVIAKQENIDQIGAFVTELRNNPTISTLMDGFEKTTK